MAFKITNFSPFFLLAETVARLAAGVSGAVAQSSSDEEDVEILASLPPRHEEEGEGESSVAGEATDKGKAVVEDTSGTALVAPVLAAKEVLGKRKKLSVSSPSALGEKKPTREPRRDGEGKKRKIEILPAGGEWAVGVDARNEVAWLRTDIDPCPTNAPSDDTAFLMAGLLRSSLVEGRLARASEENSVNLLMQYMVAATNAAHVVAAKYKDLTASHRQVVEAQALNVLQMADLQAENLKLLKAVELMKQAAEVSAKTREILSAERGAAKEEVLELKAKHRTERMAWDAEREKLHKNLEHAELTVAASISPEEMRAKEEQYKNGVGEAAEFAVRRMIQGGKAIPGFVLEEYYEIRLPGEESGGDEEAGAQGSS